ncbi:helix-turn-helix domain-containing protein [Streptomyces sp. NPDC048629]|uniref:IclR family transcriptional regulator n=1 Tax=Streptomyces sp. NPDC048629 TaxID=3154824 RepID=UPI00341FFE7B
MRTFARQRPQRSLPTQSTSGWVSTMGVARHHRGVDRIVTILESVAHSTDGLTLSQLAKRLEAPVSTIQGLVNGLLATGYLIEESRRFTLGPGPFTLTIGADWTTVAPVSHDLVSQLAEKIGYPVLLGVMVGDHLMYVDGAGEDARMEFYMHTRSRRPLINSAGGKLLLASLEDTELSQRLGELREIYSSDLIEAFLHEVLTIRSNGFATSTAVPGACAVAVGVPGTRRPVGSALVAVGPREWDEERARDVAEVLSGGVRTAATRASSPSARSSASSSTSPTASSGSSW